MSRISTANLVKKLYRQMIDHFGAQNWWPAENFDELVIGVVLTQNTNWRNVEKALEKLKQYKACSLKAIHKLPHEKLAGLITSAGYFNIKAKRLKSVAKYFVEEKKSNLKKMKTQNLQPLRQELLNVNGIGPESVDSILLYGLDRESFVIDAYTIRIGVRHGLYSPDTKYEQAKKVFEESLSANPDISQNDTLVQVYNEYHALLVRIGNKFCKPKPNCRECPLNHKSLFRIKEQAPQNSIIRK